MTQEDKELLLKDLCGRLPYGVMIHINETNENEELYCLNIPQEALYTRNKEYHNVSSLCPIEQCKPLLRPLSSLTEQEITELGKIDMKRIIFSSRHLTYHLDGEIIDWFNKNHIDFRGLIPNGLAIAVTKENNPYIQDYD